MTNQPTNWGKKKKRVGEIIKVSSERNFLKVTIIFTPLLYLDIPLITLFAETN